MTPPKWRETPRTSSSACFASISIRSYMDGFPRNAFMPFPRPSAPDTESPADRAGLFEKNGLLLLKADLFLPGDIEIGQRDIGTILFYLDDPRLERGAMIRRGV